MADVTIDVGNGQVLAAAMTRGSVERMGLTAGEMVLIIKATEVMPGERPA